MRTMPAKNKNVAQKVIIVQPPNLVRLKRLIITKSAKTTRNNAYGISNNEYVNVIIRYFWVF